MNEDESNAFIGAVANYLQILCYSHVKFTTSAKLRGHFTLTLDSSVDVDFILNERVCKTGNNKSCMSNSYRSVKPSSAQVNSTIAEPDSSNNVTWHVRENVPKQTKKRFIIHPPTIPKIRSKIRKKCPSKEIAIPPSVNISKESGNTANQNQSIDQEMEHSITEQTLTQREGKIPIQGNEKRTALESLEKRPEKQNCTGVTEVCGSFMRVIPLPLNLKHSPMKTEIENMDVTDAKLNEEKGNTVSSTPNLAFDMSSALIGLNIKSNPVVAKTLNVTLPISMSKSVVIAGEVKTSMSDISKATGEKGLHFPAGSKQGTTHFIPEPPPLPPLPKPKPSIQKVLKDSLTGVSVVTSCASIPPNPPPPPPVPLQAKNRNSQDKDLSKSKNESTSLRTTYAQPVSCASSSSDNVHSDTQSLTVGADECLNLKKVNKLPYSCKVCDRQFTFQTSLRRHHREKHLKIRFICPHCGMTFTQKVSLFHHVENRCKAQNPPTALEKKICLEAEQEMGTFKPTH